MSRSGKYLMPVIALGVAAYIFVTLTSEPGLSSETVSDSQRAKIATIMGTMAANGQYSGTVLVSVGGEPIYTGAFGLADIERGVPNSLDTQFRIASATKPFTTLLVYQLAEAGKLNLDDKLSDLLPEYPAEKGASITVEHLLRHRSGITGEGRIPELADIERHRWTRDKLLQEVARRDLVFPPGTGNEYSNYGYFLLGLIIERAGGASYAEQLPDLHRFALALEDPAVLPADFREMFFNECGWMVQHAPVGQTGRRIRGNYLSGSINGFASHILRIEKDGIFIALLKNMKEPGAQIVVKWPEYVTSRILAVLYGEPFEMPRKSAAFAVFEVVRDQGVEAGRRRYAGIVTGQDPAYYV